MAFNDTLRENGKMIIIGLLAGVGLYTMGKGMLFGYAVNELFIYGALVAVFYIFNMLHKDLIAADQMNYQAPAPAPPPTYRQSAQFRQQQAPQYPPRQDAPFSMDVENMGRK